MSKSKMKDINGKTEAELLTLIKEKREVLRSSRFGLVNRDVKSIQVAKKDVARALTALSLKAKENKS